MCIWPFRVLCLLALAACAPLAHAQIYRCIGAHGEPVFAGEPCGTPASTTTADSDLADHAFGGVCAASPAALRERITAAFQTRNVNLLAGLILWQGIDQTSAKATLRALSAWLREPLAGIATATANGSPDAPDPATTASAADLPKVAALPTGFEVSTGGDGSTRDFGVTQQSGCWWLTL